VRKLAEAGHRNVIISDRECVQTRIEQAKQNELYAHESGKRVRGREFQDRIKAMQARKAQETSAKNARRAMNQTRGKK
jgi:hypothetical protein